MATKAPIHTETSSERDRLLVEIQNRVLWLAMQMVHYANNVRENPGGLKVGGHQASSSSVVTVMTSLYFDFMRAGDRISVKPHASPVYHAIQYLLGNLDQEYLKTLRAFHGLQAYPSRTKDPDPVDSPPAPSASGRWRPTSPLSWTSTPVRTSTREAAGPTLPQPAGRRRARRGGRLEAIAEPSMTDVKNVLWVVDLNRQSLDRVIPGDRVQAWRQMFVANGWQVIDAKYGKRLQAAYAEPNGELLRLAIDEMPNEVYQRLLRVPQATLREWLPRTSRYTEELAKFISRWSDEELQQLIRNLGGHDFAMLREALSRRRWKKGPTSIFAYTLKGWMLPPSETRRTTRSPSRNSRWSSCGPSWASTKTTSGQPLSPTAPPAAVQRDEVQAPVSGQSESRHREYLHPQRLRPRLPGLNVDPADIRPGAHRRVPQPARRGRADRDG